jgi:hypothetical protein
MTIKRGKMHLKEFQEPNSKNQAGEAASLLDSVLRIGS